MSIISEGDESMENLLLGLVFILINFVMVLTSYKLFGRIGLFLWIGFASILCNIQVMKQIEVTFIPGYFSLITTLGNTLYGSVFLATDILTEKYGEKEAKKSVLIGFFGQIVMMITMTIAILFQPIEGDLGHDAMVTLFSLSWRIVLGSVTAYFISQLLDIYLFARIKDKFPRWLWLRNNAATAISQLFDSIVFTLIAFAGVLPLAILFEIMLSAFIFKVIIALLDTPFLYAAVRIKPNEY